MITNDSSCHINWKQFECVQLCSWAIVQEQNGLDGPRRPFSTSLLRASTHPSRRYIEDSLCSLFYWAAPWLTRHSKVSQTGWDLGTAKAVICDSYSSNWWPLVWKRLYSKCFSAHFPPSCRLFVCCSWEHERDTRYHLYVLVHVTQ